MSISHSILGGGIPGSQPKGGLPSNVVDGGNTRNINRIILRKAFGNNLFNLTSDLNRTTPFRETINTTNNPKYVYGSSDYMRFKKLEAINKTYNNLKY